ncbi:flagellar hook-basal body complex protein FliE [Rhodoblastus sp.]|uniref:flagellar hook-basal body complex protein FliE n=1 Tax=Rhodoblastus sp. TaxID=1962975 RepID=UPI003F9780C5
MIAALLPLAANALQAVTTSAPSTAASASAGGDFGQFMAQASSDALNTLKTAERTSMAGIEGKASASEVVGSVMNAERSLQTGLAIRDKAVAAYQQISQMQI